MSAPAGKRSTPADTVEATNGRLRVVAAGSVHLRLPGPALAAAHDVAGLLRERILLVSAYLTGKGAFVVAPCHDLTTYLREPTDRLEKT